MKGDMLCRRVSAEGMGGVGGTDPLAEAAVGVGTVADIALEREGLDRLAVSKLVVPRSTTTSVASGRIAEGPCP